MGNLAWIEVALLRDPRHVAKQLSWVHLMSLHERELDQTKVTCRLCNVAAFTPASANQAVPASSSWSLSPNRSHRDQTIPRSSHKLFMLIVAGIGEHVQELLVTRGSTHVFRRAGSFSLDAERIPLTRLSPQAALEENLVPPGISEVVFVLEMKTARRSSAGSCLQSLPWNSCSSSPRSSHPRARGLRRGFH